MAKGHSVRLQSDGISTFHKDKESLSPSECDLLEDGAKGRMTFEEGKDSADHILGNGLSPQQVETCLCGWVVTQ